MGVESSLCRHACGLLDVCRQNIVPKENIYQDLSTGIRTLLAVSSARESEMQFEPKFVASTDIITECVLTVFFDSPFLSSLVYV